MLKKFICRHLVALLLLFSVILLPSCRTPNGKWYSSSEKDLDKAKEILTNAQSLTDKLPDIDYTYAFFVDCETADKTYRLGTENRFIFNARNTENVKGYRKNTYTSLQGDVSVSDTEDEFFLSNGSIFTSRFNGSFTSKITEQGFLEYTNESEISINEDYLSPDNFAKARIYNCKNGVIELAFSEANENITSGIVAFVGLDKTSYEYEVSDVLLTVITSSDGTISEKHLTFEIEYYDAKYPDSKLTYMGDFAFTVNSVSDITVPIRPLATKYTSLPSIEILSAITDSGYAALSKLTAIDATYSKQVKVKDSSKEYVLDSEVRFTAKQSEQSYLFGSMDLEKIISGSSSSTAKGIFLDFEGYHERNYDLKTSSHGSVVDNQSKVDSYSDVMELIISTLSSEQLIDSDIATLTVKEETDSSITFLIKFTGNAARAYTQYLMDTFSDENAGVDLSSTVVTPTKNEITITVRKSDLCILKQTIEFSSVVGGSITVEGSFSMTVNSLDLNLDVLTLADWYEKYPE